MENMPFTSGRNLLSTAGRNRHVRSALIGLGFIAWTTAAGAIDWGSVKGIDVTLFYPGQASWEWALTQADHSGAKEFREKKNCVDCHTGEEADIGNKIVAGKKLEPTPPQGKPGSINLNVKAANDGDTLYVRLEWAGTAQPGATRMDPDHEAKVTMMLDDGHVVEATRAGCWGVCHDDAIGMASAAPDSKMTKYLAASRVKLTRKGGGDNLKPQAELDQLRGDGGYLEYWQAALNSGQPATAVSGHILEKRVDDAAPAVAATAEGGQGSKWAVVLSRKLAGAPDHKDIVPGTLYTVGFAVHDDFAAHRFHHVSLARTLVLDEGKADIVAVKVQP